MKYGVISDIHGNLDALEVALRTLEKFDIDNLVCLGDIVGYGPQPNECIRLIYDYADIIVAGNHDHAVLGKSSDANFNQYAKAALDWTRRVLTDESIECLGEFPLKLVENGLLFVHSTPKNPEYWNYIPSLIEAYSAFFNFDEQICFIGHSHVPVVFLINPKKQIEISFSTKFEAPVEKRLIINVGSVGQPRDGDPRLACGVYDTESQKFKLIRKRYPVAETQAKMRQEKLPEYLISRLRHGQ